MIQTDLGGVKVLPTLVENDILHDAWGKPKLTQDFSLFHGMFTFDITEKHRIIDDDGVEQYRTEDSIRVMQKSGGASINSGTSIGQSGMLRGKRHPRYQPNRGILFSTAGLFPNPTALGGIRRVGLATEENGIFFELSVDAKLYAVRRKCEHQEIIAIQGQTIFNFTNGDIVTDSNCFARVRLLDGIEYNDFTNFTINETNNTFTFDTGFNAGDKISLVVSYDNKEEIPNQNLIDIGLENGVASLEKGALFDIQSQWRSQGNYFFYINQKLVYIYENLGKLTTTSITNPALPIRFESKNISNSGENFDIYIGCADLSSEGGNADTLDYVSITNGNNLINCDFTTPNILIAGYVPKFFKGRHTTRDFQLLRVTISGGLKKTSARIFVTKDPTAIINPTQLLEINQGSALLYYKNNTIPTMTLDTSKANEIAFLSIPAEDTRNINNPSNKIEFHLTHGDYVIVVGNTRKNNEDSEMSATIEFGEEI